MTSKENTVKERCEGERYELGRYEGDTHGLLRGWLGFAGDGQGITIK